MKARDVRQIYQDRYAGEQLIKVVGESPQVKNIAGRHGVEVGGFAVHSSGKRVVVNATIDNLLKGAATQCLRKWSLSYRGVRHGKMLTIGHREYEPCAGVWRV
jgi:N-acetyl-gamma-glutamyl-phosphate reductase / acetylglutamate kinase